MGLIHIGGEVKLGMALSVALGRQNTSFSLFWKGKRCSEYSFLLLRLLVCYK